MKSFLLSLFILLLSTVSIAQRHVRNELLVQLKPNVQPEQVADFANELLGITAQLSVKQCIYDRFGIWLFSYDEEAFSSRDMIYSLKQFSGIQNVQVNHIIEERIVPNDPFFSQQWHHQQANDHDIDSELAWDITTGGQTTLGDEIVVCVVEIGGAQWDTPDIVDNHWMNIHEIPSNGIDDDDNGFIDDYHGWNIASQDDDLSPGSHGTRVCSMIGSTGNNETGVTGVNWDVKMMMVEIGSSTEAAAIAGYAYPLEMRRLYNLTQGQQGAYVVATNSSWGTDNGQPDDAPLWCAMYDSLGVHGVLSCGSTSNNNVNVDVFGDLPTACPSDYLISVARTNSNDVRNSGGYGITSIDLAAPGDDVYLANNTGYATTTGTSFSSPCVAGGIALLYSAPCSSFAEGAETNPAGSALSMKSFILDGVDQTTQLQEELLSGGRFNVNNSLQLLIGACDEGQCMAPFNMESAQISGTLNYTISWTDILAAEDYRLSYRIVNTADWTDQEVNGVNTFTLSNLQACTPYEARIAAYCGDTLSMWSEVITWTTDGCCVNPDGISVLASTDSTLSIIWNDVLATDAYVINATNENGLTQTWNATAGGFFVINDLLPCMTYDIQIISGCTNPTGTAAQLSTFTPGCENCVLIPYCETSGNDDAEFIAYFNMGDLEHSSENSGGYLLVPNVTDTLYSGMTYDVSCTPGYNGNAYNENFRVWIDFNIDGDFDDAGELVFDPNPTTINVQGSATMPSTLTEGHSRLRVSMTYTPSSSNNEPEPCGELTYGEVEDYCVVLALGSAIEGPSQEQTSISIYPNPASEQIRIVGYNQRPEQVDLIAADGRLVSRLSTANWPTVSIADFPAGMYYLSLQTAEGRRSLPLIVHD
jgi:hypothetical protein